MAARAEPAARGRSGFWALNRAIGLVVTRATSAISSSPCWTRKVWSAALTVTASPAWNMPTWMRCPATAMVPRLLTRRFDAERLGRRVGWWSGGAGVAEAGQVGGCERVGQTAEQDAVSDELEQAAVDADSESTAGEVVADRVLPAGESDRAGGIDQPVNLDGHARLADAGGKRRWPGGAGVVGQETNDGAVGPERDRGACPVGAEPELLAADGQVPRRRHHPSELDGKDDRIDAVRRQRRRDCRQRTDRRLPTRRLG